MRTPVHIDCPGCAGVGRTPPDWMLCPVCDGVGYTWEPGAPMYDCKVRLSSRRPGEIVTLGNGDRGRVLRHDRRSTPTTIIAVIGDFDGVEDKHGTHYPSCVGVASVSSPAWFTERPTGATRQDALDPMRRR